MNHSGKRHHLESTHTPQAIAERLAAATQHSYLGDFVLGAVDGTVTTFAIVAGAAGAGLSSGVALVLGLANVLADGFSMAASNYLKSRAERHVVEQFREMEEMHIDHIPEGEREEIRQIFASKGFEGPVLEKIVNVITEDRQRWVDTMLTEEWGLQLETPAPLRAALATIAAFVFAGFIPLLPLVFAAGRPADQLFLISAALTGVGFFFIGLIRGRVVDRRPLVSGVETLLIGGAAATLAYVVGLLLRGLAT